MQVRPSVDGYLVAYKSWLGASERMILYYYTIHRDAVCVIVLMEFFSLFCCRFLDKRNTGPRQTPEWTVESLDEYTTAQGRAISWARRAKEGAMGKVTQDVSYVCFGLRM